MSEPTVSRSDPGMPRTSTTVSPLRVLWLTSGALPETAHLTDATLPMGGSWLQSTARHLAEQPGVELYIAFPVGFKPPSQPLRGGSITYVPYRAPTNGSFQGLNHRSSIDVVVESIDPDLIHVFGTEGSHAWDAGRLVSRGGPPLIVSVQGLIGVIAEHYLSGIPNRVAKRRTIRDLLRRDGLLAQERKLRRRGHDEASVLRRADRIIGRTSWDRACVGQIAPGVPYDKCNENLRDEFQGTQWRLDNCTPFRVFLSQGYYPIKGLHRLLAALAQVTSLHPETSLHVAGPNPLKSSQLFGGLRRSSYALYLRELLIEHSLLDRVRFLGPLDEASMMREYLDAHVHVLPLSIENSSNSLGEAMCLGVPTVASYVGGNPDYINHDTSGFLYQADAPYMLAHYISQLFTNSSLCLAFSEESRSKAREVFNPILNTETLIDIYLRAIERKHGNAQKRGTS